MNSADRGLSALLYGVLGCLLCASVHGAAVELSESAQLHALLTPMRSFSARFEQRTRDDQGLEMQQTNGVFEFAKPKSMRWVTQEPMTQEVITDGRQIWIYDAELEQVIVDDFDAQMSVTPALIFSGSLETIDATYAVRLLTSGESNKRFLLTPLDTAGLITSIEVIFSEGLLSAVSITSAEQINEFTFSRIKLNQSISAATFTFKIPADIEVIDNR
ncbi:MAG: outer membrane lipoprotein chaperone LolA [Porticoccaceae bacterium]|nr:outer membrane lipoprotein chaperone LolA [Porticoccaceae bacterium]